MKTRPKPCSNGIKTLVIAMISLAWPMGVFCLDIEDSLMKAKQSQIIETILLPAGKHMLVKARLNGKTAYFLIDTGASCSVLHTKSAKHFGYDVVRRMNSAPVGTTSFGRRSQSPPVVINANLQIGPHEINRAYMAKDISSIRVFIFKQTNLNIVGIIGTDMLKALQAKIDLRHRVMTVLLR